MNFTYIFLLVLLCITLIHAKLAVTKKNPYLYDKSAKLRFQVSGLNDIDDVDAKVTLQSGNLPISNPKHFSVELTQDEEDDTKTNVVLKLLMSKKWAILDKKNPIERLYLTSFSINGREYVGEDKEILLCRVIITPTVEESDQVLYRTSTSQLVIRGTGFVGAKEVDLFFDPPLYKEVEYEDVTDYPNLEENKIVLRLRHGYEWAKGPGVLKVAGIDTGAGPLMFPEKVIVANIEEDVHKFTVKETVDEQLIYYDQPSVLISGTDFDSFETPVLKFSNNLLGGGVNYTISAITDTTILLNLEKDSFWRANPENLPAPLTLLTINPGTGPISVGPINSLRGKKIAMVFQRPVIHSSHTHIYRTHSHELHVKGEGFPFESDYEVSIKFNVPLVQDKDFFVEIISRTELEITLNNKVSWSDAPGPLTITKINTRGDNAGWITFPGEGIFVAEIIEDEDSENTGGIEVIPMGSPVYQSALNQDIQILGSGFKEDMQLFFSNSIVQNVDFTFNYESPNKILLKLKPGKKWANEATLLTLVSIKTGGKTYNLAGSNGIRVAVVLANPTIASSSEEFHQSQSKLITISGTGFTNYDDIKIKLRPTPSDYYKIHNVLYETIRIKLEPNYIWLPSYLALDENSDKKIDLQVVSIDTGAGEIEFDKPVTIGYIVKDRAGVVCDDSCEFAFDGFCDDGSEADDEDYFSAMNYLDDQLGGFYQDDNVEDPTGEIFGGLTDDDYYMENENYLVSACVKGTDCTDCGGVDAIIDYSKPLDPELGFSSCTNTCAYANDGVCDDPRGTNYCDLGTDCSDCGPVGADNFTISEDDDGWWDDDDDYWNIDDVNFIEQVKGLEANRHRVRVYKHKQDGGPAGLFLVVLEGLVYTVGFIFLLIAAYFLNRWYNGHNIPFLNAFTPDNISTTNNRDFEMRSTQRMAITPDEFRS